MKRERSGYHSSFVIVDLVYKDHLKNKQPFLENSFMLTEKTVSWDISLRHFYCTEIIWGT